MVGKTQPITKADREHFSRLKCMRCVCCQIECVLQPNPTTAHHLLSGGRRRGHRQSIPLCEWHHQAVRVPDMSVPAMTANFGPSLANGSKPFHARYGTDDSLLEKVNALLGKL